MTSDDRLILDWLQFGMDAAALTRRLRGYGKRWTGVLALARGGLPVAVAVSHALDIRVIETVRVRSYEGRTRGVVEVVRMPPDDVLDEGRGWLIVDDLVDSGETMRSVKARVPYADAAVVYAKPLGLPEVTFAALQVPQKTWIVFPWEA